MCACAFLPRVRACLVNKRVLLLPRVRACFFSCTGLGLSSSSYRPSAPRWVGSFTRCGAPSRAQKNCSSFLHDDCRGTRSNPSPVLPLPGVVSEPPLAHRQDRAANIAKTRKYFDVTVKNETGPTLFHTWEGYEAHLPRREACVGPPLDLYACNYYVTEADLDALVQASFTRRCCRLYRYLSARACIQGRSCRY